MIELVKDEHGPAMRLHGVTHSMDVVVNDNKTGWVFFCYSGGSQTACNISRNDAYTLAEMLLAGPEEN